MKKIIILIITILFLFACNLLNTPSNRVEDYLDKYTSLDEDVIEDLETTILKEGLSEDNKKIYKEVLLREYENIKYEIIDESIDGDKAYVRVKLTVINLNKSSNDSLSYMNEHIEEFSDVNHNFDKELFNKYRLNNMLVFNDSVDYEITFRLTKINNEWVVNDPDRDTLEKIHGLYNG